MPIFAFHENDIHLSTLYEGRKENEYPRHFHLGSTATMSSTFQLLKALDILVEWGNTEYWTCGSKMSPRLSRPQKGQKESVMGRDARVVHQGTGHQGLLHTTAGVYGRA